MRNLVIAVVAALAFSGACAAEDFRFQPTRNPFLPFLTVDQDHAICSSFLDTLTAAFKGESYDLDRSQWDWRGRHGEWIFPVRDEPQPGVIGISLPFGSDAPPSVSDEGETGTSVYSLAADIDGDGNPEVLAMSRSLFNWTGNHYALMLFSSPEAFDAQIRGAKSTSDLSTGAIDLEPDLDRVPFFHATTSISPAPPFALIRLDGAFFSLSFPNRLDDRYTLARVVTKTRPTLTCAAAVAPPDPRWQGRLAGAPVAGLIAVLRRISGTEAYGGGTAHWHSWLLADAEEVEMRAILRPWVLDQVEPRGSAALVQSGLAGWGEANLYNHRQWRALKEIEPAALDALTRFYADGYGLPATDAARAAKIAIDLLIRSHFAFPSSGIERKPDTAYRILTRALLDGAPRGRILDILSSGAKIRTQVTDGSDRDLGERWYRFVEEPTLFYALESPGNLVALLEAGADANVSGNYGKTALMYAAQFDLVESAKVLLVYGADPNAVTNNSGFETALNRSGRSALMYAAENASPGLIRLLLSRGADPTANDSSRRGVLDYLKRNPKLSPDERAAIAAELTDAGAKP